MFDLLITGGEIIDGTRRPRYRADLAIEQGRIAAIGNLREAEARSVLSAAGKIVAPGFIDVHNHSDGWLLKTPHLTAKTRQGFTTEVIMADGISYAPVNACTAPQWLFYLRALNALRLDEYTLWQSLEEYMRQLDGRNVQNAAWHIPYANVRTLFCGFGRARPDDYQMRLIKAAIAESMEQGAVGLSTGLDYIAQCFAGTDELVEACSAMQPLDGLYVSHVRYKKGVLAGVQEALEIGRRAGVRVHISHLKGTTPEDVDAVLGWLDELDRQGADLSFDVYPYLPGSTMLNYLLPYEVWEDGPLAVLGKLGRRDVREKFARSLQFNSLEHAWFAWVAGKENARLQGTRVADYVAEQNRPAADVLCDLLIEERLAVLMVFRYPCDDTLVEPFLAHPRHMLGTDGIYHPEGVVHPRMYGSVGRFLGPLVREKRLVSLEDAVWKLSGFPAERFRLPRGKLAKGAVADVVVFDPATIAERATYADPHRETVGIEHVLVAGTPIIREGQVVEDLAPSLPGRLLPARTELRAMA